MEREPIRIRLVPREPDRDAQSPREAFWRAIRRDAEQTQEISYSEGKLSREFGGELRQLLIRNLTEPLRLVENSVFRGEFRNLEHFLFRFFDRPNSDKSWDQGQVLDAFTRLLEQRQQFFRESPGLRRVQDKIAAAASVNFTVRVSSYSSLNLDLSVGSLKSVAEVFENDFESFRVFLEAFVPQAFGRVFSSENADRIEFTVHVPPSYAPAFQAAAVQAPIQSTPAAPAPVVPSGQSPAPARERAEWLWRLANGSLLVPLLLALIVMYQGMTMLKEFRSTQFDAMKPVLEHQLKLLEEDRRRLFKEPPSVQSPASTPLAATK